MEAVVWLEDYLSKWDKILFLVSHSQDFMNNVCTHIVHLTKKKLAYYSGVFIYTLYMYYGIVYGYITCVILYILLLQYTYIHPLFSIHPSTDLILT